MAEQGKSNPISQGVALCRDSWEEIKKVHPPTKQETLQGTIGVMFMVFLFGIFLGMADLIVGRIMQSVLSL